MAQYSCVLSVITLRVIDSDSTKTHIQLRWLYLYYVQRHTGAKNTGYTGAKTGNPGATIMINTDPKQLKQYMIVLFSDTPTLDLVQVLFCG